MRMKNVVRDKQGVNDPEGLPVSTADIMYSINLNYYTTVTEYMMLNNSVHWKHCKVNYIKYTQYTSLFLVFILLHRLN